MPRPVGTPHVARSSEGKAKGNPAVFPLWEEAGPRWFSGGGGWHECFGGGMSSKYGVLRLLGRGAPIWGGCPLVVIGDRLVLIN